MKKRTPCTLYMKTSPKTLAWYVELEGTLYKGLLTPLFKDVDPLYRSSNIVRYQKPIGVENSL